DPRACRGRRRRARSVGARRGRDAEDPGIAISRPQWRLHRKSCLLTLPGRSQCPLSVRGQRSMTDTRLSMRLDLTSGHRIGPGKIALLEAIRSTGSISAAARRLGMSYRRAWLLVEEINGALRKPAVASSTGGRQGGGAALTPMG